jgi:hypothetical protein
MTRRNRTYPHEYRENRGIFSARALKTPDFPLFSPPTSLDWRGAADFG